jgi:hypothetical protein
VAILLRDALTGGGALRHLLAKAQKQGLVRRDVKVDVAAQMLGGAVLVAVFQHGLLAGARTPRPTVDVDEVVRLFLRGIAV